MGIFDIDHPSYAYSPRKGVKFSSDEVRAISIAIVVLTLCFTVAFSSRGIFDLYRQVENGNLNIVSLLFILGVSFVAVLTAFLFHEIAHKVAANHYGYPAAFSYSRQGLMFAAFFSLLFGFLFAAPGAVLIYGRPSRKENGVISLAGPLVNLIIGILFGTLFVVFGLLEGTIGIGGLLAFAFLWIASINMFIGAFNMIPLGILDGAKIWRWSKVVYLILLVFYLPTIIFFVINIIS